MAEQKVTLYGHQMCPMVPPVRAILNGAGVPYAYINIKQDDAGRDHVRSINDGNESVPTLVFPDGSTMTEPTTGQLKAKLADLGYSVPLRSQFVSMLPQILGGAIVIWALLRLFGIL